MGIIRTLLLASISLMFVVPVAAFAENRRCNDRKPVNSINEMFSALYACWQPPKGTAGMSITLRFSLRRDGTLIGKPRTTFTEKINNDELSKAFVVSILEALNKSLPVPFTESMGGAVAGRPMTLRFISQEIRDL